MLTDPPKLTVKRGWSRATCEALRALSGLQTGHATDAQDGRGAIASAIKPLVPLAGAVIGTALPCETGPNDNLAVLAALALAQPGDVVIVAGEAFSGSAVVGDNVMMVAKAKGLAGLVVDGMARDLDGLEAVGLALFGRGITPNSCVRSGPGRVGLPVICGGVRVEAGDAVVADRDGVVIIPQAQLADVLARLEVILEAEQATQARLADGWHDLGGVEALLQSDETRYVD